MKDLKYLGLLALAVFIGISLTLSVENKHKERMEELRMERQKDSVEILYNLQQTEESKAQVEWYYEMMKK
jgi:hypothetical protein